MTDESDPELDQVVADLQAQADRLRTDIGAINDLLTRASLLSGAPQSAQFMEWWVTQHRPALSRAVEAIDEFGDNAAPDEPPPAGE